MNNILQIEKLNKSFRSADEKLVIIKDLDLNLERGKKQLQLLAVLVQENLPS